MFTAEDDLALAHALADVADTIETRYFRLPDLSAQIKADGSLLAEADRLVEAAPCESLCGIIGLATRFSARSRAPTGSAVGAGS